MQNHEVQSTFLAERYHPGFEIGQLRTCVTTVRDGLQNVAQSRSSIRILCSVIVPDDEAFLVLFQARSEQQVAEAFRRTGVTFDRISAAVAEFTPPEPPNAHP
jgi:hypothetical protein